MTLNAYSMDTSARITELLCSEYVVEQRYGCTIKYNFVVQSDLLLTQAQLSRLLSKRFVR